MRGLQPKRGSAASPGAPSPVSQHVKPRYLTLDALRGIAALAVVFFRSSAVLGAIRPRFGYLTVDLFIFSNGFVLSKGFGEHF